MLSGHAVYLKSIIVMHGGQRACFRNEKHTFERAEAPVGHRRFPGEEFESSDGDLEDTDLVAEVSRTDNTLLVWRFDHQWRAMHLGQPTSEGEAPVDTAQEETSQYVSGRMECEQHGVLITDSPHERADHDVPLVSEEGGKEPGNRKLQKEDDNGSLGNSFRLPRLTSPKPYGP